MAGANILGAASISPQIIMAQQIGVTDTAVYSVGLGKSIKVATATLCNTSASAVTVNVSLVPVGGTVGDGTHKVVSGYSLAANDTLEIPGFPGAMLGPGDMIAAYAGTASVVVLAITGTVHA